MAVATITPKSVFITGCNSGIGLEFVKQLLKLPCAPKHIFATCRDPHGDSAAELKAVAAENKGVHVVKLDVTNYESLPDIVREVEEKLEGDGLSMLINNAGMLQRQSLEEVQPEQMRESFEVNTVAPLMITKAFLPLIKKAANLSSQTGLSCSKAAIINITSKMGSCADNTSGKFYPYRTSKAALNMVTKSMAMDLQSCGILAAVLHPGWVLTKMGGQNALVTTEVCLQGLINVMSNLNEEKTGTFWEYKGIEVPW